MIQIIHVDIVTLEVDAIVNAANSSLLGGGGVDGAIHRTAGPQLRMFNQSLGGCEIGEAKISPGFNLRAKWIIHTVGPMWRGGKSGEPVLLASCYRSSFELALESHVRMIAFPSISTGVFGYPKVDAATIAVAEMKQHESSFEKIIACCFSTEDA